MTTAVLYRMATKDHLCPFGLKSRDLLEREGFDVEDRLLTSRAETEAFKAEHGVKTTPQTFIRGERVGGYDALRARFGLKPKSAKGGTSYALVLTVFATAALGSLALQFGHSSGFFPIRWLVQFVALSMLILAVLKLRDLEAFSNQFLGYDQLARRKIPYAYIYPFAEAAVAIGMLAWPAMGVLTIPVALTAIFIGSEGAYSVYRAVYIEKRELKCACVGGDSNVPLGAVSLSENLAMLAMGLWMLFGSLI